MARITEETTFIVNISTKELNLLNNNKCFIIDLNGARVVIRRE